jgi:signal transduction histidine kinase
MELVEVRLRTLTQLAVDAALAQHAEVVCTQAIETLMRNSSDVAWAAVYLIDGPGRFRPVGATSKLGGVLKAQLRAAIAAGQATVIRDGSTVLVPLHAAASGPTLGVLALGVPPQTVVDEDLLTFFTRAGQQVAAAITVASIRRQTEKHLQIVALQDHALQTFFVIGLMARAALAELPADQVSDNIATALVQIIDAATTGREHLREAVFALGYADDERQRGVIPVLQSLARNFQQRTGIEAELLVRGASHDVPTQTMEIVHQTAAEALANIERNSQAGAVVLSLQMSSRSLALSIQDDGVGVTNPSLERIASSATHFGLRDLGKRVRGLGGTFVARPTREGGFVVRTRLPLSNSADGSR